MKGSVEQTFRRDIDSLKDIFTFIEDFFSVNGISTTSLFPVHLAVEELFTNILKYQSSGKDDVLIRLEKGDNKLVVQIYDFDSEPFDFTKLEEVNPDDYIKQNKSGGLGIHLVKKIMDNLEYEYNNRTSKITLIKNLEK